MLSRITLAILAAATILTLTAPVDARTTRAKNAQVATQVFDVAAQPAYPTTSSTAAARERRASHGRGRVLTDSNGNPVEITRQRASYGETVIGGRSGSCLNFVATRRLWCGCGSADEVGLDNSDGFWNLAANWFTLPRSEPGYNKAVVRRGHVAILKSHVTGTIWMAFDPNSGGQLARLHEIDLRWFRAVVDPAGQRAERKAHHRRYASRGGPRS